MAYIGAKPAARASNITAQVNGAAIALNTNNDYTDVGSGTVKALTVSAEVSTPGIRRLGDVFRERKNPPAAEVDVVLECAGAQGQGNGSSNGRGGLVAGTVRLKTNETIYMIVGAQGANGGFPGGNASIFSGNLRGGGFSGFWLAGSNNPLDLANRGNYLLIGGGGGGSSGSSYDGGGGGYPSGQNGSDNGLNRVASGGSQSAGGLSGINTQGSTENAQNGSAYFGGRGGDCTQGGAGGGGWFGGGGNIAHCGWGGGGGGGGSSYYNPARVSSFTHTTNSRAGNGYVRLRVVV